MACASIAPTDYLGFSASERRTKTRLSTCFSSLETTKNNRQVVQCKRDFSTLGGINLFNLCKASGYWKNLSLHSPFIRPIRCRRQSLLDQDSPAACPDMLGQFCETHLHARSSVSLGSLLSWRSGTGHYAPLAYSTRL